MKRALQSAELGDPTKRGKHGAGGDASDRQPIALAELEAAVTEIVNEARDAGSAAACPSLPPPNHPRPTTAHRRVALRRPRARRRRWWICTRTCSRRRTRTCSAGGSTSC